MTDVLGLRRRRLLGAVGKMCTPWSSRFGAKQLLSLAPDLQLVPETPQGSSWVLFWGCQAGDPRSSMCLCSPVHGAGACGSAGSRGVCYRLWGAQGSHQCSPLIIPSF